MSNNEEEGCLAFLLWMVWFVPGSLLGGWVMMLLWGWFITPLGAPGLGLWHAIGLNIILGFIQHTQGTRETDDPLGHMASIIGIRIFMAAIALGAGWVVLQLMGA